MYYAKKQKIVSKRENSYRHLPGAYDYDGLAHWWAYNYGYKSTAGGRMSAAGNQVKSYSTVIATMFDPPPKQSTPFVLIAEGQHSSTTATHKRAVENAVLHMNYIFVSNPDPYLVEDHESNMASILASLAHLGEEYPKKRIDSTRNEVARRMTEYKVTAEKYASYFKLKNRSGYKQIMKFPMPGSDNFIELLEESNKSRMQAKAKAKAKKARKLAQLKAKEAEKAKLNLAKWLAGENVQIMSTYLDKTYMRIKKNKIETTNHASIGLIEAVKSYLRLKKGTLKEGMHIGPYVFGGIDTDDNAHIGCHTVPLADIDELIGIVVAEKEAYVEEDRRNREAEFQKEMDELPSFDDLFEQIEGCLSEEDGVFSCINLSDLDNEDKENL